MLQNIRDSSWVMFKFTAPIFTLVNTLIICILYYAYRMVSLNCGFIGVSSKFEDDLTLPHTNNLLNWFFTSVWVFR